MTLVAVVAPAVHAGEAMTPIRDRGAPAEPGSPLAHLSRGVHLIDLVTSGVIRRARHELPVAISPDPGRSLRAQ